ncbi:MAG: cysteine--tRNA ligase, partial [Clostridia bacterium]|nr:cysteine--tRNA ligase [Clostridia bacterium]
KMSKSKGNFFTVRDVSKKYDYEVIRFFMLSAHYRSAINFSDELLAQSKAGLDRLYNCLYNLDFIASKAKKAELSAEEQKVLEEIFKRKEQFKAAMDDDLNTADAIAALFDLARTINTSVSADSSSELIAKSAELLRELGAVLGIFTKTQEDTLSDEAKALIEKRKQARADKDWALADSIRDELKEMGIELEDTRQGVKVHIISKA